MAAPVSELSPQRPPRGGVALRQVRRRRAGVDRRHRRVIGLIGSLALSVGAIACSGSGSGSEGGGGDGGGGASGDASVVVDVRLAAAAVEAELGGPQEFFEITSTPQLTNVFVATEGGTAAVPYIYLDGELEPPAPAILGVEGHTFTVDDLDFDEATVLSGVAADLPTAVIDTFSVEGAAGGFVRYVISARSAQGGVLDIVVTPTGAVVEVRPL